MGGAEGVDYEPLRVLVPLNDVDLLALELVDDVLYTDASEAYAGANGVDAVLTGPDGDLAAGAGLPGDGYDLHGAVIYLRHLHLEQAPQQPLVGPGDDKLRPPAGPLHALKQHLYLLSGPVPLVHHLLGHGQDGLGAAKVDDHQPRLDALDVDCEDLAFFVGELLVDELALRLSQPLHHHLFGGLGGDPSGGVGYGLRRDGIAQLHAGLDLDGVLHKNLL